MHYQSVCKLDILLTCTMYVFDESLDFSFCVGCAQSKKVDSKWTSEVRAPSQAAVERAAVNARAGLARNMVAPKTAYEFEATWKGFANDRQPQSRLLKIMEPSLLPKVFKDLLGAPLLMEIINSLPLLLPDDARFVLRLLENLVKVGRFAIVLVGLASSKSWRQWIYVAQERSSNFQATSSTTPIQFSFSIGKWWKRLSQCR
ncbi:hypothetical protein KC19_1G078800 [Ceratodon purpureus]|uniref:RNA-polymerase II-associated protein 3-like C-terminal domain-containing protein n=1 Tax=Ceratodon purpureus TaxID=3225 RepID=A0A8T0J4M3_CERPU|nr:hypothetical protein KC19_1G078800 [Ceratodon purpureus]